MVDWFRYQAKPDRVVDGDTLDVVVDLGFDIHRTIRVRLDGVDTAEIYGTPKDSDEYERGMRHKQFVEDWLADAAAEHEGGWPIVVDTYKNDETGHYGRYLAYIKQKKIDQHSLNDALVAEFGDNIRYK